MLSHFVDPFVDLMTIIRPFGKDKKHRNAFVPVLFVSVETVGVEPMTS